MKKITNLDARLETMSSADPEAEKMRMPTRRVVLCSIGNVKADTADEARRIRRILTQMRDRSVNDLILENDDISFLEKVFEKNAIGLSNWMLGQTLEIISDAEKVDPVKPQVV